MEVDLAEQRAKSIASAVAVTPKERGKSGRRHALSEGSEEDKTNAPFPSTKSPSF